MVQELVDSGTYCPICCFLTCKIKKKTWSSKKIVGFGRGLDLNQSSFFLFVCRMGFPNLIQAGSPAATLGPTPIPPKLQPSVSNLDQCVPP